MTLARRLADRVLTEYPKRAALVLERLGDAEALRVLGRARIPSVASLLECLSPHFAATLLYQLPEERISEILAVMPVAVAARLLRRADPERQAALFEAMTPHQARSIRSLLRFREGSAGTLMDPDVLALPQELTAREAMRRIRGNPELARYNLYVVDQSQRLTGTLNLRELLLARGPQKLGDVMVRNPQSVLATADRSTVLMHRGWKVAHALPVVDEDGTYLGAIRYRTLREIEGQALATQGKDTDTSAAIAQLLSAAAGGLLDAVAGSPVPRGRNHDGD